MDKVALSKAFVEEAGKQWPDSEDVVRNSLRDFWFNPHEPDLRLTAFGAQFLYNILKTQSYTFRFKEKEVSGRYILLMCRNLKEPFFYHRGSVQLFGDKEAMMIQLCGSIEQYLNHIETVNNGK